MVVLVLCELMDAEVKVIGTLAGVMVIHTT
jgi:hypothetical protein